MISNKHHSVRNGSDTFVHPAARFVQDLTHLITDVDRLVGDVCCATQKETGKSKSNGSGKHTWSAETMSNLREHARSFYESLPHLGIPPDRVPVPYLELDARARIVRTNQACAQMLNGSSTPLAGKSLFSFVAESDIKTLREHLAAVRRNSKPGVAYVTIIHKGQRYPAELRIHRHPEGGAAGYVAVVDRGDHLSDDRVPVQLQKNGLRSLFDLFAALSNAQTMASVGDAIKEYSSKAFASAAGMIVVKQGEHLEIVSQWHSREAPKKHFDDTIIRKGPVPAVFRTGEPVFWYRHKRGAPLFPYLIHLLSPSQNKTACFLPVRAAGKPPIGVLAIALPHDHESSSIVRDDLSRLAQMVSGSLLRARDYNELEEARLRAEGQVKRQDDFLSALSHELKNFMTPILGWAVALSSGTLPTEKQNLAIEGIVRNIRALNYLIEDMFDAVRISSGKLHLASSEIRIQEVAREALTVIQRKAEAKRLRISTEISEAVPPFLADPHRLRQILLNLLNNAVKFTPAGGAVSLKILRRGNSLECTVSDTGKGIEAKFLPFVFDKFRQEPRSSKTAQAGLGLGLAIVREIVNLHDGTIKAYSKGVDKGASFIIRLPLRRTHGHRRSASHAFEHA